MNALLSIEPGKKFDFKDLSLEHKLAVGLAIKQGCEKMENRASNFAQNINGWLVGSAPGDRAFCNGDWLLRAAAAKAGICRPTVPYILSYASTGRRLQHRRSSRPGKARGGRRVFCR